MQTTQTFNDSNTITHSNMCADYSDEFIDQLVQNNYFIDQLIKNNRFIDGLLRRFGTLTDEDVKNNQL